MTHSPMGDAPADKRFRRSNDDAIDNHAQTQEGAPLETPTTEKAPPPPPFAKLEDLPLELHQIIVSQIDDASVCRLYAAYSERCFEGMEKSIKAVIEDRLKKITVYVSPEKSAKCDTTIIDFETLALLPPWCDVHIKTSVVFWELVKIYLWQLEFASLMFASVSITIYGGQFERSSVNFEGLEGNVVAVHLVDLYNINTSDIPKSTLKLSFTRCSLNDVVDLTHLSKLTHVYYQAPKQILNVLPRLELRLLRSVNSLSVHNIDARISLPLPKLRHYTGSFSVNIPWNTLKTVVVDHIPNGTRCYSLEEVTITEWRTETNFKTISCPNLRCVTLTPVPHFLDAPQTRITDVFTHDQLKRLKTFKGNHVFLDDLTSLEQVEVLYVIYDHTLTEDTPLSPHLVELKIISNSPVEGIPGQLTAFEYVGQYFEFRDISITSTTLKRLSLERAGKSTVNCPHLEELALKYIEGFVDLNTSKVRSLSLEHAEVSFKEFPSLRQLYVNGGYDGLEPAFESWAFELSVGMEKNQHLESVTLEGVLLGGVSIKADNVSLIGCLFAGVPFIEARSVQFITTKKGKGAKLRVRDDSINDSINCEELTCNVIRQVPRTVEKVSSHWHKLDHCYLFYDCNKLTSCFIECANSVSCQPETPFVIPTSVVQLVFPDLKFRFEGSDISQAPAKLEFYHRVIKDAPINPPPNEIVNEFVQIGPNTWCRPDTLQLRGPFSV
ncbi:hypothetical protein DIURU_004290 [Diutina rugosa]|uniref:Uncharacterized protein n=1 Tax=Diutina rugosa TaxID=5481 RepID=A0A642UPT1_DIURU|nr:uncharacterized protein DIURU_004290 [Diutina rugosa]KAA8899448.1 hypothetical protein DIURU_004290 [Diutina rugosa]